MTANKQAVHDIVMSKLQDDRNIILCLENIDDWCNTHTRGVVMEVRCLLQHSDVHTWVAQVGTACGGAAGSLSPRTSTSVAMYDVWSDQLWRATHTLTVDCLQADPGLDRTLVVGTKLDQRLGSWQNAQDADSFINPPLDVFGGGKLLGGAPFLTSVPPPPGGADSTTLRCALAHLCMTTLSCVSVSTRSSLAATLMFPCSDDSCH